MGTKPDGSRVRKNLPLVLPVHNALANEFNAHKIPMILDPTGGFQLCKATIEGKQVHLLVDSGAQLELAMTKEWATAEGKELTKSRLIRFGKEGKDPDPSCLAS